MRNANSRSTSSYRPNGPGAAAVLAAGIGTALLGILTTISDKSAAFKSVMIFYKPTGALSGVTTIAIVVWLASWATLHVLWSKHNIALKPIVMASFAMLVAALLLTFPPFIDFI